MGYHLAKLWLADQVDALGLAVAEAFIKLAAKDRAPRRSWRRQRGLPVLRHAHVARVGTGEGTAGVGNFARSTPSVSRTWPTVAVITSIGPRTDHPIRAEVTNGTWNPVGVVVRVARTGSGRSTSCSACPHINFHSEPATAAAYLQVHSGLAGQILDQSAALALTRLTFDPLLRTPRPIE